MKKALLLGVLLVGAGLVVSVACSGSSGTSSSATTAQVQTFDQASLSLSQAVATYRTQAAGIADPAACAAAQQAYQAQANPLVVQMQQMAGPLDDRMMQLGQPADADITCATSAMKAELDRHAAAACVSSDPAVERAEAASHASVMEGLISHQQDRAEEMGAMMGIASMMDGGMTRVSDGGWSLPDGGAVAICQVSTDGGFMFDGGMMSDGGIITDGGVMTDGGIMTDGGVTADGGMLTDGGMMPNGGM